LTPTRRKTIATRSRAEDREYVAAWLREPQVSPLSYALSGRPSAGKKNCRSLHGTPGQVGFARDEKGRSCGLHWELLLEGRASAVHCSLNLPRGKSVFGMTIHLWYFHPIRQAEGPMVSPVARLQFQLAAAFHCAGHGDFVRILDVASGRHSCGDAGYAHRRHP